MDIKYEKFTGDKTYTTPIGTMQTPQNIRDKFPAVDHFTYVIGTDQSGQVALTEPINLNYLKSIHSIDLSLNDDEAILAIQEAEQALQNPTNTPSPQERIAASLEFQNMMNL